MKLFLFSLLFTFSVLAADIVGFWKTIDDATKKAQSVVAVYPYKGKYYGRIVATYDEHTGELKDTIYTPDERAPGVVGDPHYAGLDLIYNLVPKDHKFVGNIIDPQKGKEYGAELWVNKKGNLIVRGKILIFGRNQEWLPFHENEFTQEFPKPDVVAFVPVVPKVKK